MAFLKSKPTAAEPYRVPPLAMHTDYAVLCDKRAGLLVRQSAVRAEKRDVERQIAETPAPALRRGVAELLEEAADSTTALRARLAELTVLERDIDAALEVLRQRLAVARTAASRAIVEAVRPEYARRVSAVAHALEAVAVARAAYDELRDQFEREDVSWGALGPASLGFLGEARDGHIERFVREAKSAGYY
jgi:hypothetical protein